jgi:hypothetical protein
MTYPEWQETMLAAEKKLADLKCQAEEQYTKTKEAYIKVKEAEGLRDEFLKQKPPIKDNVSKTQWKIYEVQHLDTDKCYVGDDEDVYHGQNDSVYISWREIYGNRNYRITSIINQANGTVWRAGEMIHLIAFDKHARIIDITATTKGVISVIWDMTL